MTGGITCLLLACFVYWVDIKGQETKFKFSLIFGVNAIFAYTTAGIFYTIFYSKKLWGISLSATFMEQAIAIEAPKLASLAYALFYVFVIWIPTYQLYKRKSTSNCKDEIILLLIELFQLGFICIFSTLNQNNENYKHLLENQFELFGYSFIHMVYRFLWLWDPVGRPTQSNSDGRIQTGFWFAQQGAIYVFVILIFVYIYLMNRLDQKFKNKG